MEKKQKNLISIFLLIVGVIFILVAGSIFVTTAWKYLPVFVKQMALLVVALGMFGGSYGLSKNEKLTWISQTLFHVGNAFVGFFVIAIMGGVVENNLYGNALKVMAASVAMTVPVIVKVVVKKSAFDFAAFALLVDSMLISGCVALFSIRTYVYLFAAFVVVLALMDAYQQKHGDGDSFDVCVGITYLIHSICYTLLVAGYTLSSMDMNVTERGVHNSLFVGAIVAITGLSYVARDSVTIRVCNSLSQFWLAFVAVYDVLSLAGCEMDGVMLSAILFALSLITVFFGREEMIGLLAAMAVVIPFGQLLFYFLDAFVDLFVGVDGGWSTDYNPYSIIIGVAMFALYIVRVGCDNVFRDWKESKLCKFAAAQMGIGFVMWMASKMSESWAMVFYLLVATDVLLIGMVCKLMIAKKVMKTLAMMAGIAAMMCQPFVEIPSAYNVEWNCLLVAISIVLFRIIWYDKKDEFSILYYIATCVILGVLLISNLVSGGIGNVLILGMTGMIMLIAAALLNDKKYVIAASVTLILLVLYLTREFWLSIAWWVYLFAAGVVLVLLAVKKAKEA